MEIAKYIPYGIALVVFLFAFSGKPKHEIVRTKIDPETSQVLVKYAPTTLTRMKYYQRRTKLICIGMLVLIIAIAATFIA